MLTNRLQQQPFFIADIGANHDGDLERAKDLIFLAKESGADAAKFQHFNAPTIVSSRGFQLLGKNSSHQASWKKSVVEIYRDASIDLNWTKVLADTCAEAEIMFMTSPYHPSFLPHLEPYVEQYKIGSGEITWLSFVASIAAQNKPYYLATGASTDDEVVRAVNTCLPINPDLCLMQCNSNYTGARENFNYVNLRVLLHYRERWPSIKLGLSDHTAGHATVLGAIALGATVIEKHFTDDNGRYGPDHAFAMSPLMWSEMVDRSNELWISLGDGVKRIEENECETTIVQRRSAYFCHPKLKGSEVDPSTDLVYLRPALKGGIPPCDQAEIVGKHLVRDVEEGEPLFWKDLK